ncbi:MAG: MmcQ/YjbR family DNA-binding protein, partial [Oscillibacter sp.]|nr:MmcQ/YjbR family DNA-binding protein [Oscillibacter sp.]
VVMDVERRRLGLDGEGAVCVMDTKCGPLLGGSYLGLRGVLPAYHMNKTHWITVLLDGTAEDTVVRELLEISYDMTKGRI